MTLNPPHPPVSHSDESDNSLDLVIKPDQAGNLFTTVWIKINIQVRIVSHRIYRLRKLPHQHLLRLLLIIEVREVPIAFLRQYASSFESL